MAAHLAVVLLEEQGQGQGQGQGPGRAGSSATGSCIQQHLMSSHSRCGASTTKHIVVESAAATQVTINNDIITNSDHTELHQPCTSN